MAAIIAEGREYGREEFYLPTEDFHRVRPTATLSVLGSGALNIDELKSPSINLPPDPGAIADLETRAN